MSKKDHASIRFTTIASFVLVLVFSVAWAGTYYRSKTIRRKGGVIPINQNARLVVPRGALDDYLNEQGENSVEITVELIEDADSTGFLVIFGPSGAYFDPPVRFTIRGNYVEDNMLLFDENGEALEYTVSRNGNRTTFYIPHFSIYSYDDYDYD